MKGKNVKQFLVRNNTYFIFIGIFIICAVMSDRFLSVMNLTNILLQQAGPICVVLGMLFVVMTGGIDLSVGSVMAVGSALTAYLITNAGMHFVPAMLIALLVGILQGLVTGFLVAYCSFQGFVASLSMMTISRGIALIITNGSPIRLEQDTLASLVQAEYGYPILIITAAVIVLFAWILRYTSYGRIIVGIGSNKQAIEMAGIQCKRYILVDYAVSALLATLGGIFVAARASTGSGTVGEGQELDAIAACVIGGTSLAGGNGSVIKAVVGAFVLALIKNIMNLLAVPAYPQDIIEGVIIIAAVLLQVLTSGSKESAV